MKKGPKETMMIRAVSALFVIIALAVFKPFGLDTWQWDVYVHLLVLWVIGFSVCMLSDLIVKYVVRKPRSYDHGVSYIIRRNLWFQIVNTPLIALAICLYRHFVLSDLVESNYFSLANYLETLAIIAFCSFAIGLYWRFKFRSRFLAAELEETRLLNEQLKRMQEEKKTVETTNATDSTEQPSSAITLTGTTNETVSLMIENLLYVEAVGNYVKVCHLLNDKVQTDMLRATSKQIEDELNAYSMIVRSHRAFLVNLKQVEKIHSQAGAMQLLVKHCHEFIPVSRSNMAQVKETIKSL